MSFNVDCCLDISTTNLSWDELSQPITMEPEELYFYEKRSSLPGGWTSLKL